VLGTTDNQPLEINVNGSRVMRYEPNANSPNVVGGHPSNSVSASAYGQTVAGGGLSASTNCIVLGVTVPCPNRAMKIVGHRGGRGCQCCERR
jgi:hypothetical protein